ncbi:MAG: phosphoglucosamine mutase [Candidatus Diapherotrites archaeon]
MKKLFGTDGIRGKANCFPMIPELMVSLGKALAKYFSAGSKPIVVLGKDTRVSGYMLETALTSGLVSAGADVFLVGPLPTPAIAYLIKSFNADFGIMISASHNHYEDNGIKVFDSKGYKLSDSQEEEIEALLEKNSFSPKDIGKAYRIQDAKGRYIEYAKSTINNMPLEGFKIVVDCANGAAYDVAPSILKELGAKVIPINCQPNGYNINLNCGALEIDQLSKRVVSEKADLGIALDGDADRVVIVDSSGKKVNGDYLLGLISLDLKNSKRLNKNKVVATIMSNSSLEVFLKENGISLVRTKVGDRYVIEAMREQNLSFGGEQSGHIIIGQHNTTGDGIIASLELLKVMKSKNLKSTAFSSIFKLNPQVLVNVKVSEKIDFVQLPNFRKKLEEAEKELQNNGRVLARYSGTENVARIMVEAKSEKKAKKIANDLAKCLESEVSK